MYNNKQGQVKFYSSGFNLKLVKANVFSFCPVFADPYPNSNWSDPIIPDSSILKCKIVLQLIETKYEEKVLKIHFHRHIVDLNNENKN